MLYNCCIYGGKRGSIMLALFLTYLDDENDKRLFEEMFYSYRKQMLSFSISILKNKDDAEDAVHNVFLRIAQKNWDTVRSIENSTDLRNYLLKATKNSSLNIIKLNKRESVSLNDSSEYSYNTISEMSDDEFIEMICAKIEYDNIVKAIYAMNEKYRDVLYFHFITGMTISKTAKLLNQTTSTTKKQLVRGKKMLLNLLGIKGDGNNGNEQR